MFLLRAVTISIGTLLLCARGHAVELIRDINQTPSRGDSRPGPAYFELGNLALFQATDAMHGREWWVTNGTTAGTRLLADIWPGPELGIHGTPVFAGIRAFFTADDGTNDVEVWVTDGTPAGTRLVINLTDNDPPPNCRDVRISGLTAIGNRAVFFHHPCSGGHDLWISDGTFAGTSRVTAVPAALNFRVLHTATLGSRVFFWLEEATNGFQIWSTDGTASGTSRRAGVPLAAGSFDHFFYPTVSSLYAQRRSGGVDRLWYVANTGAEPMLVQGESVSLDGLTSLGCGNTFLNTLVCQFTFNSSTNDGIYSVSGGIARRILAPPAFVRVAASDRIYLGRTSLASAELWVSDGSMAGTTLVKEFVVPNAGIEFLSVTQGSQAFFQLSSPGTPPEVWTTDGTSSGTRQLTLTVGGVSPDFIAEIVAGSDAAYILAGAAGRPPELWRSDGTQAGTWLVSVVADLSGVRMSWVNGLLYFRNFEPDLGVEPFVTDGSPGSLFLLKDIEDVPATLGSVASTGVAAASRYYFQALDDSSARALWRTDGTAAGTHPMMDAMSGNPAPGPIGLTVVGSRVVFVGFRPESGAELWFTDTISDETRLLRDFNPGASSGLTGACIGGWPVVGGRALVSASIGFNSGETDLLMFTDGTDAGTGRVFPAGSPFETLDICQHALHGGELYFGAQGRGLYRTDGTATGTFEIMPAPSGSWRPMMFASSGGLVYFVIRTVSEAEIWRTDGTAAGTRIIGRIAGPGEIGNFTAVNGNTVLLANCGIGNGCTIFATDGTAIRQLGIGGTLSGARGPDAAFPLPVLGARAWLQWGPDVTVNNFSVASTDGLAIRLEFQLPAGMESRFVPHQVLEGQLVGLSSSGNDRWTLWRSDRTLLGTVRIAGFHAGQGLIGTERVANDLGPFAGLVRVGAHLVFFADDGIHGVEPWSIPDNAPSATPDLLSVDSGLSVINAIVNDGDFDGEIDPRTVEIVAPPVSGTAQVNALTGMIEYRSNQGFGGADRLMYRVRDDDGKNSNVAAVDIWVRHVAGPAPPPPPPPPPPPQGGGGGGGSTSSFLLLWISLLAGLGWLQRMTSSTRKD